MILTHRILNNLCIDVEEDIDETICPLCNRDLVEPARESKEIQSIKMEFVQCNACGFQYIDIWSEEK